MKIHIYLLLVFMTTVIFHGPALAECNCRQAAYMDKIDFLTRYTQCLEQCFTSQLEQIKLQLTESHQKISDLESRIDQLNLRIKDLNDELAALKVQN